MVEGPSGGPVVAPALKPIRTYRLSQGQTAELRRAERALGVEGSPRAARAYLRDPRNVVVLASVGESPVGLVRGTVLSQLRSLRPQFLLYEIEVRASHRRRGVGAALVRTLVQHCRRLGCAEVFVLTEPSNRAAVQLYRATGATTETTADRMYVFRLRRGRGSSGGAVRRRPRRRRARPRSSSRSRGSVGPARPPKR